MTTAPIGGGTGIHCGRILGLRQHGFDHVAVDVGEAAFGSVLAVAEAFVVEAQKVEGGGVEGVDGDGVLLGFPAEGVGGAVGVAFFDASAGKPAGEAAGVVVAAAGAFLESGHPAEEVEDGGVEIVRGDDIVLRLKAELVGGAVAGCFSEWQNPAAIRCQ